MKNNMVTAQYTAIFSYDILMQEKVSEAISLHWEGLGEAVIIAPELIDINKLKEGHYGSRQRIDVTLDISKKPDATGLDTFWTAPLWVDR
jgi:hypothetical protein